LGSSTMLCHGKANDQSLLPSSTFEYLPSGV
jgi:hypothetical protein